jgi:cell division initiation protein
MPEPLAPEDIENVTFPTSLRGYDRDSVDIFLQEVAAAYESVLTEAQSARAGAQKPYRSLGEEMGDLLQHAKDSAEVTKRAAAEEAAKLRQQANEEAAETLGAAERRSTELLADAERAAADKMRDAAETVAQLEAMEVEAHEKLTSLRIKLEELTGQLLDVEARRATRAAGSTSTPTTTPPLAETENFSIVPETDEDENDVSSEGSVTAEQGGM